LLTLAEVVKAFAADAKGKFTTDQLRQFLKTHYADKWKDSTLQAHMYACSANNPKAYVHHPYAEKFLYRHADGSFELYSEELHGPNEWAPTPGEDEVTTTIELEETTVSLERDIEDHLVHHVSQIEKGLKFTGRQVKTDVGRIDLMAEDPSGTRVIIELKVGEAKDSAIGQIARYIGWYSKADGKPARGLLIAQTFPDGTKYAAAAIPSLKLVAYKIHFSFEPQVIAE
jgi:endonuclease